MTADDKVTTKPPSNNPSRKVSIVTNFSYDNPAFESRSRKVSAQSEHAEIGPVRKKSILVNHSRNHSPERNDSAKHTNGEARSKKNSVAESMHSRTRFSDIDEDDRRMFSVMPPPLFLTTNHLQVPPIIIEPPQTVVNQHSSWWYTFCVKCRGKESHPSWHPAVWPKLCPYPFCMSYRQFSRIIALTLIGALMWGTVYAVLGDTAAPGGQLFQLIFLTICAHFGGWLMNLTTLPKLIGMLFVGLLFQNVGLIHFDESFSDVTKELRKVALVIILIRAGLDLDPSALKRLKFTVLKLGLAPWLVETVVVMLITHYFMDLPWSWAILLGTVIAAVSPAVVVACLFRLRAKGYGVAKGIPTLIIAVAGIDDATSVAIYGIIQSIMFSNDSLTSQILQGPISIFGGIGFGVLWGLISAYAPERYDPFVVPLRVLMLLMGGLIALFGSELIGYGGAGPLGCVAAAFVSLVCWSRQGWEIEENPATTAFEIFWMIFEPILFGITGAQIKLNELDPNIVSIGVGCLVGAAIIRIIATILLGIGCKLNLKEKIFVALSWMSKATVQAALGPVALGLVGTKEPEKDYAEKVLMICVLSIILTAPTGAILITLAGPRLLTKTKFPQITEGWRRSHRPSIRDISIIDEEEERDNIEEDPENPPDSISNKADTENQKL